MSGTIEKTIQAWEFIREADLSPTAALVLLGLADGLGGSDVWTGTITRLADRCGLDYHHVAGALAELRAVQAVFVIDSDGERIEWDLSDQWVSPA